MIPLSHIQDDDGDVEVTSESKEDVIPEPSVNTFTCILSSKYWDPEMAGTIQSFF